MSDKMTNSFRSYVGLDDQDLQNTSGEDSITELNPRILAGEVVIAEAQNVLMFAPVSEQKHGKSGTLYVTNFKLSFVTTDDRAQEDSLSQQNSLLAENEVCLSNVDIVYQVFGDKKKKLIPGSNVSTNKVKGIYIICKNMRVLSFSFKFSPVGHGKMLTNALLHHAFPSRHHLLFAYDYREPYYYACRHLTSMYRDVEDWQNELENSKCSGWRISSANRNFEMSFSLPMWLIVPESLPDKQLIRAASHFQGHRPPLWVWGTSEGAALVRMAELHATTTDRTQENIMLEQVRKSHPGRRVPHVLELSREVPTPKELQTSYCKLRELCTPETIRQLWVQDSHFMSQLELTRWLHSVSLCLCKASEAATHLLKGFTVVLQESEGRDMCCVISSLCQLLLVPQYRTLVGFQALIQKEWVSLGHPFSSRLGHVLRSSSERSPELLLFLDCVWQLLQQFPIEFEFTETYLTTLWDSAHISIFETFLFDCERDRDVAAKDPQNPLILRSVWDWDEQFSEARDQELFHNPLFRRLSKSSVSPLSPRCGVSSLQLWAQCYYRWLPPLEIKRGGRVQVEIITRALAAQIQALNQGSEPVLCCPQPGVVGSFFPFGQSGFGVNTGAAAVALLGSQLTLNTSFLGGDGLDSQSLLNAPD
ncbi:myotubularin-related protein 10-B [Schistocerca nitens]|uniref:myotubularin-related protein 10-B n=1 Tax=Schistocerca nitens TaxID=7011 RepID=UPI0021187DC3|nr:myotubularin-related protein 10-B [Schistocerca nitens]